VALEQNIEGQSPIYTDVQVPLDYSSWNGHFWRQYPLIGQVVALLVQVSTPLLQFNCHTACTMWWCHIP